MTRDPVDAYIRGFPPAVQAQLQAVRAAARQAAPQAEERISYRMPALFQRGVIREWFAGGDTLTVLLPQEG